MKASWACAVAASLLLAASAVNGQVATYQKNNFDKILYGVEAPFSASGSIKVYVDPDNNGGTGQKVQNIGADFRVDDDGVFSFATGSWVKVGPATVTRSTISKDGQQYTKWEAVVSRQLLGETEVCEEQSSLVYDIFGTATDRMVHRFTNGGRCWTPAEHAVGSTLDEFIFEIKSLAEWNTARVYIDADKNPTTGFSLDEGWTGAEYMLEEDKLYERKSGSWALVTGIFFDYDGDWGVWTWRVGRSQVGDTNSCATQVSAAFEGTPGGVGGWIQSTTSRVTSYTDCFALTVAAPASVADSVCPTADCALQNLGQLAPEFVGGYAVVNMFDGTVESSASIRQMESDGLKVLALVDVDMGRRSLEAAKADIEEVRKTYTRGIRGIMFNNMYSNDCKQIGYMVALKIHVRTVFGADSVVAANPQVTPPGCYMDAVDIMMNFDGSADAYLAPPELDSWVYNFPSSKFMHAVSVTSEEDVPKVVAQSEIRHAANLIIYLAGSDKWVASQPKPGSTAVFTTAGELSNSRRRRKARK